MCPPCPRTCVHHVSGPYRRTQKEPKGPRPIVRPSLRSGSLAPVLLRGHAATGHPWPIAALPASMPVDPLHRTSIRPPGGRVNQKPDQKQFKSRSKTQSKTLRYAVLFTFSPAYKQPRSFTCGYKGRSAWKCSASSAANASRGLCRPVSLCQKNRLGMGASSAKR